MENHEFDADSLSSAVLRTAANSAYKKIAAGVAALVPVDHPAKPLLDVYNYGRLLSATAIDGARAGFNAMGDKHGVVDAGGVHGTLKPHHCINHAISLALAGEFALLAKKSPQDEFSDVRKRSKAALACLLNPFSQLPLNLFTLTMFFVAVCCHSA